MPIDVAMKPRTPTMMPISSLVSSPPPELLSALSELPRASPAFADVTVEPEAELDRDPVVVGGGGACVACTSRSKPFEVQ